MATNDKILNDIRAVKQNLGWDWDYEDGYGELKNMVFQALDIADELREAVLINRSEGGKTIYGSDIPDYYKPVIVRQLEIIKQEIMRVVSGGS